MNISGKQLDVRDEEAVESSHTHFAELRASRTLSVTMPIRRHHFWFILSFIFLCALVAYAYFMATEITVEPPNVQEILELDSPAASPDVDSLEELGEYLGNKPVPPPSDINIGVYDFDDHIRGGRDAPITILEYSNLTNRYARLMHPGLRQFVEQNEDVNWIFRHYYLDTGDTDHMIARASECVARDNGNEAFWTFADDILENSVETQEEIIERAVELGALPDLFRNCIGNDSSFKYEVGMDAYRAQSVGDVFITPSFFIINNSTGDTRRLPGADTIKYIAQVVDAVR